MQEELVRGIGVPEKISAEPSKVKLLLDANGDDLVAPAWN